MGWREIFLILGVVAAVIILPNIKRWVKRVFPDVHLTPFSRAVWRGIIVVILLVGLICGLWVYGFIDAADDVQNGLTMMTYQRKLSDMNLISRQGYKCYIENNTDMLQRQREIQQKTEKLDKEMEKLDKLFNP